MVEYQERPEHPGVYVRREVLPHGLSVTEAAKRLSIGRPALSDFLHGKASLSPEMAVRLEKSFGASRSMLLEMQARFDDYEMRSREKTIAVRKYTPSFLQVRARQIEAWGETINARAELAALLRRLVTSTGDRLSKADFPAFDNSQRRGWDGQVTSHEATPWIPLGESGWEFGVKKNVKPKADGDYIARTTSIDEETRRRTTFVFVTSRNWSEKEEWAEQKRSENEWKDVVAYDASDLEQWLEQSIPAQAWLSEKLGLTIDGIESLEGSWASWADVCDPTLSPALFDSAVNAYSEKIEQWLASPPSAPMVIAADSLDEAAAFCVCALDSIGQENVQFQDRAVVVSDAAALRRIAQSHTDVVAVVRSRKAELALSSLPKEMHTIVLRHKGSMTGDADISLGTMPHSNLEAALKLMNIARDRADQLERESGSSLTVLRRRLSTIHEIRRPPWCDDSSTVTRLVPLVFAGVWRGDLKDDREVIAALTQQDYDEAEKIVTQLLTLEQPPVWAAGKHRGLISKIDTLYAVAPAITAKDLENFFEVAQIILSEEDPALELPEEDRWAASLYGKTRESSEVLRRGLCETFVLLSTHGNALFQQRLGLDVEGRVNRLIRDLLTPSTPVGWQSQRHNLQYYAEAAPDEFLQILEEDLDSEEPTILSLMQPTDSGVFGDCPRSGLLWALEILAWKPERLLRVSNILARLATYKIDDNWANTPVSSLRSLYRSWMPQTAATMDQRQTALASLCKRHPETGWSICADQFSTMNRYGSDNARPRWRNDALGAGGVVTNRENYDFMRKALDIALDWPIQNENTLGDLVERLTAMPEEDQQKVWDLISSWVDGGADDASKAALRERIRQFALTRRGRRRIAKEDAQDNARKAYENLEPADLVLRHHWLFAQEWVEPSAGELEGELGDEDFDYEAREKMKEAEREQALREIWERTGFDGVLRLLSISEAASAIGRNIAPILASQLIAILKQLATYGGEIHHNRIESCLGSILYSLDEKQLEATLQEVVADLLTVDEGAAAVTRLLTCAPFNSKTWRHVESCENSIIAGYWSEVHPRWSKENNEETEQAIDELLGAGRPRAALRLAELNPDTIETSRLIKILRNVATSTSEPIGQYRFRDFDITRILSELSSRSSVSPQELARLEMLYISVLEHTDYGIPNLQKELASSPSLFIEALAFAFRRNDGGEDPEDWSVREADKSSVAISAHSLLRKAERLPGMSDSGEIDGVELKKWIYETRRLSKHYGRFEIGDQMIGQILSHCPIGEDRIWPCEAVREVLEDAPSKEIAIGMRTGVYNSRGVVTRGDSGQQERDLATKYRVWAQKLSITHPFTASMVEDIARSYDRDAEWWDNEAEVRSRLNH